MAKMNSTSLYITTSQIILKSDPNNPSTWQDLYRLAPYLRNSLCCVVCGNLLTDPLTPVSGKCQHHICRKCKGGRKKIKPACVWCKDCKSYTENQTLRILLQCYKKMCIMLTQSGIFQRLLQLATQDSGFGASNLIMLIKEGASFEDDYQINVGLSKSLYSILPCIYTNSSTQTLQLTHNDKNRGMLLNSTMQKVTDHEALYSITYAGSGNKITIKRKSKETHIPIKKENCNKALFKKPTNKCILKSRHGCRCGNATATPGKLTCCGQRCPCYVESKACLGCKCRGCRNPHRPDGNKVRPHVSQVQHLESISTLAAQNRKIQVTNVELDTKMTVEEFNEHLMVANIKVLEPFKKIPTSLPHAILVSDMSEDEEITVDV
uniref:CXC MSL2-type domain-containing protein n=1 Tax=Photinus pyralis TaxID=7054 RepID=A0A1Y1KNL2_PHOPY